MILNLNFLQQKFELLLKKSHQSPYRFIGHQSIHIKQIQHHSAEYLKIIFESYSQNKFKFSTVNQVLVKADKERWVFQYALPDLLVHYCLADFLMQLIDPLLSENLFSYRKGRNSNQVLKKVDQYIRSYKKKYQGDLKQKGLYVIRKDIKKYTDSIVTGENSILFRKLENLFNLSTMSLTDYEKELFFKSLTPDFIKTDKGRTLDSGTYYFLPTGSPLSNVIGNFYLNDLDHELSNIKDSFYIRFGDDILFITDNLHTFQSSLNTIEKHCSSLNLHFNQNKSRNIFLNGCGRSSKNITGSSSFQYLGAKIDFNEGVLLASNKKRKFFNTLRHELRNYANHSELFQLNEKDLIHAVNHKLNLNKNNPYLYLDFLLKCVSSRKYLSHFDRDIAYEILKILKKDKSKKVFRNKAYKKLRCDLNLLSIVMQKNELNRNV